MEIIVSSGVGTGPTELAAFDAALLQVGLADFNVIRLSSVIPPGARITQLEDHVVHRPSGTWGDRAYVVYAEQREVLLNHEAWAGVGWVQDPSDGRGLFVEHEGSSELQVRTDLTDTLTALCELRGIAHDSMQMMVRGGLCEGEPICALVTAFYRTEPW